MIRLPRVIRFDTSDDHVFPAAVQPGEWAVSGSFVFSSGEPESLSGKQRQAFANGFLGLGSFGWTTFVTVAETDEAELDRLSNILADYLVRDFGAPERNAALLFARAELEFVADMCRDVPINTLFAVSRELNEDGSVHEAFRRVQPPEDAVHTRIWDIVSE